ncbi:PepSY domain-containing protein [Oceanobacillus sp. J11TS1]|uniref:PepSY domain-containing protein n=1 Tax=Oceanobacillus sp. J11TS1 TaxID=2807191 RepID=UPI001B2D4F8E|nr:PepSY domain-containing protein [Oceanobacillus sp. J11TS1]GIO24343.1 hypothetical protein J11TS1_29240 [Oceanobacillus sp. J11TS1]
MNKKIGMIAGAVALAGVIGVGVYHTEASSSKEADPETAAAGTLTIEDATKKLEEEYQGTVKELELDKEGNKSYYEAEIIAENQEKDVKLEAETGEVVFEEMDEDEEDNQEQSMEKSINEGNLIAQEKAIELAKQEFDGEVVKVALDHDDGRYVYEIELFSGQQEADIDIHAETGEILSLEIDHEDD